MLLQLVASSFEALGETGLARSSYEEALKLAPNNDALLAGLGILLYGREDERAAVLFEEALEHDSPLIWPAFFLAHFHLVRGELDRSLPLCQRALHQAVSDQVRADLTEWLAICQSELSFNDEEVYALFQRARSLASDNARIAHNIQVYGVRRQTAGHGGYEYEPAELLKVHRGAEPQPVTLSAA